MARVKDPVLFSTYFGVPPEELAKAGLVDPFIDVDVPLFIDPILLHKSTMPKIRDGATQTFRNHFTKFIRLLSISEEQNDAAWKGAQKLLNLDEPPENGLGYGGSGRSGSSRPDEIRQTILITAREIVRLGSKDPDMISLMGFFEEGVGPDTISDFTTRVILNELASITEDFCRSHKIPVQQTDICENHHLPVFRVGNRKPVPMVLVPIDIVRDLPIANDWSDVERAAMENARIRERVSAYLGGIAQPTISDRKAALRSAAMSSANDFDQFLVAVKSNTDNYDPNIDALGYYRLKAILANGIDGLNSASKYDLTKGPDEIVRVVMDILSLFRRHVENGNLWEELWIGDKPKKERASQLIFYAIADCFCKANNVDISPETNMGGGPIDFKFSSGYSARVLVEMKRSGGTVVHGYETQLELYKQASQSDFAVFVIMDYGDLGFKLTEIQKMRQARLNAGLRASDIIVIDARKKASASKRKPQPL